MKRAMILALVLVAALVLQVAPALAQQGSASSDQYSEGSGIAPPATITFELTVEGEVPEGRTLGVSTSIADAPAPAFCSTATFHTDLPRCEAGGTYTDTFDLLPAGSTLSYEYHVFDYEYGGIVETFAGDTITISDGQAVSATYKAGDSPDGEQVTLTGVMEKPEGTTYQYGTHGISDWDSGYYALQSDTVDLNAYIGQKVNVYGTLVPGYENAQVEGGPPLVEVTRVEPSGNGDIPKVTLSFELTVEGPVPAGRTNFFGYVPAEGGFAARLTDPEGDGLYTGSVDVPQYGPGPTPVPEGTEPVTLPVQIVQTTGIERNLLNTATVIKDFGQVLMDEDKTFSASISFEDAPEPTTPEPTTPGPTTPEPTTPTGDDPGTGDPGDDGSTGSNSGSDKDTGSKGSSDSFGGISVLPDTGGFTLTVLGAAVLLTAVGLLFKGLLSAGLLRRR